MASTPTESAQPTARLTRRFALGVAAFTLLFGVIALLLQLRFPLWGAFNTQVNTQVASQAHAEANTLANTAGHWPMLLWCLYGVLLALTALLLLWRWLQRLDLQIEALNIQADSLRDQSFNLAANQHLLVELAPLGQALNRMASELAVQRASLYQRELLLDTVLQTNPAGLVLTDSNNRVLLTNPAARALLSQQKFDGSDFFSVLAQTPALLEACQHKAQGLVHLPDESVWHVSVSQFQLNQRHHWLYLFKPMTRELQREEIKAWKKLLRVIGHELNNSLAPMSSLAFSGKKLVLKYSQSSPSLVEQTPQQQDPSAGDMAAMQATSAQPECSPADEDFAAWQGQLMRILEHLAERSQQLNQFLQGYLEFARLPPPVRAPVAWAGLINQWQNYLDFELVGDLPSRPWLLDSGQLSQLMLNLLKNAKEAGASEQGTTLTIRESATTLQLLLQDDAGGMSEEVFAHAMVPFYTTKHHGSGIGLALCRDIMESHGGRLELRNQTAGLCVVLTFVAP